MVTTFYPPHVGGIEYHVENLSKELTNRGHKITILTTELSIKNPPSIERTSANLNIVKLKAVFPLRHIYPSLSSQGFTLNTKTTIEKIVKEKKIDVIHVHGHHYYLTWRAITVAHALRIPLVLTLHGLFALHPANIIGQTQEELFNWTIFRSELKKVNAVIGLTPKITNFAQKYFPSQKLFTIPNGVNLSVFKDNFKNRINYRKKYGISEDKLVVLFIGRFAPIKRVLELALCCKSIVERNNNVLFLFVGGGPLTMELSKIIKPLKGSAMLINWIPFDKVHEIYIVSDIFILLSKSEALPLTILEAMAANLHIIATPVGGIPDVLQAYPDKTFLTDISPTNIINSVLKVIKGIPTITNKEVVSSSKYVESFDWKKIAPQIEDTYHKAV